MLYKKVLVSGTTIVTSVPFKFKQTMFKIHFKYVQIEKIK